MLKKDLQDWVCRPFCSFFRDGEKEDLLCQGAWGVSQLVKTGRLDPEALPSFNKSHALEAISDPDLVAAICRACPFQAEDCDFQSTKKTSVPSDVEPCGGYILLRLLIINRYLVPADLKTLNHG